MDSRSASTASSGPSAPSTSSPCNIAQALDDAIVFINAHQKEARESLRPYLPAIYHSQIPLYGPALYLTTTDSREEDVGKLARKFRQIGVIPEDIDVKGTVYHATP